MSTSRPEAREAARRLGCLEALEAGGLAVLWKDELERLEAEAREARRLHQELKALQQELRGYYQG